ncbi:MAG: nucleotidyltransferase substrate binding protein [Candidatus Scalindua sp.]|nr:nucleotidyltransferase substrate binding protein [Candidatus Scalindua sp.]
MQQPFSVIVRDAAIQRFEYTFEACWKFMKDYLRTKKGITCNSPKSCFRKVFTIGMIQEGETVKFLEMTDDRNMTCHTYKEKVAQIIYGKLEVYSRLLEDVIVRFGSRFVSKE